MTDESTVLLENFTETAGSLQLEVISTRGKRRVFDVQRTYALIGRGPGCDIRLNHADVSLRHVYLQIIGDRVFCIDLCSKSGTRWDNRAKAADWLLPGQDLTVGPYRMRLVGDGVQSSDDSMIVPSDFNPLAKYRDEAGSLPHVDIEFLNGSTDQPIWTLNRMITLVGRSPRCKICFETSGVSHVHCSLVLTSAGLWVVDLLGKDGTKVDGERIRCVRVDDRGRLDVGSVRMRVRYEDAAFPRNCDAFIEQAVASKLVTHAQIDEVRSSSEKPLLTSRALMKRLITEEILTPWQAQQIISDRKRPLILEDRYKLLVRLGTGGMATVYRARDMKHNRDVAVKFPNAKASARPISMQRFRREAIICGKLEHPNLVRAFDVAQDGSFLVLEFIDGQDLRTLVSQNGPLDPATAVHYVIQMAEALEFAYQNGVIHRDIKPANILVTREQKVKILDLGLASLKGMKDLPPAETEELHEELTQFGVYVGTVRYMAPEQAKKNRRPDIRSDIYSLGCTLYELLSGASPFNAKDPAAMIRLHHSQPVRPIPNLDDSLWSIMQKILAKDAESRYQSHAELAADLIEWQQISPENRPTVSETDRTQPAASNPKAVSSSSRRSKVAGRKLLQRGGLALRKNRSDKPGTSHSRKSTDLPSRPKHPEKDHKPKLHRREALRDEIAKLKGDSDALRGELSELQDQCRDLRENAKSLDIEFKEKDARFDAERVRLETERRQLESERAEFNDRLTKLKAERDAWDSEKAKFEAEQAQAAGEQDSRLEIEQQELEAARRELSASNQSLQEQRDALEEDRKLLLERKESFAKLTAEVEKKSLELDENGKTFTEEQTSLHTSFEELRREQQRFGEERIAFEDARSRIQTDADRSSKTAARLDHRRRKLARDRKKLRTARLELESGHHRLESDQAEVQNDRRQLEEESTLLRTEKERVEKFDDQSASLRAELKSKTSELESVRREFEAEVQKLDDQSASLRAELETKTSELESLRREFEAERARFQADTEQLRAETEELRATHTSLEKEMSEGQRLQREQFESQQTTLRSEMSDLQGQLSELREERSRFAAELENLYRQFRPPTEE